MITLAIDTSAAASVALVDSNGEVRAQRTTFSARKHAEFVGPAIREITQGMKPQRVIVGVGPGPFTGLRAGIATGVGYALGLGIPIYGLRSHDALAFRAAAHGITGDVTVATDARRKEVYATTYRLGSTVSTVTVIDGPRVVLPADLTPAATRIGRGFVLYAQTLCNPARTEDEFTEPTAGDLGLCAQPEPGNLEELGALLDTSPLYLREPDAQPRQ